MNEKELWKKCADFHGHVCPGLTIGYKAALYAIQLLNLTFSQDEDVVCITENDACGVDAIQVILGCSVGKGNLLFHITGKQAFSIYERNSGKSVRLVLNPSPVDMSKDQRYQYLHSKQPQELFTVKDTVISLPERAKIFDSYVCDGCGEVTGSNWIHLQNGKHLCEDCYTHYDRFHV